jgi:protein O-GlcNAc transferase
VERSKIERHFNSGRYQKALNGLSENEPSAWSDTTRLRCMRAMGHEDAIDYADQLRSIIASRSETYPMTTSERNNQLRYISLVYAEQNRAKDACKIMSRLCKKSPKVAALHREYAFALSNDSQLDKAELQLNRAIELKPDSASSHAQLALIYCRTGRAEAGYGGYSRAATLEPSNIDYTQRLLYWSNYSERTTQQSNYQLTQLWLNKAFPKHKSVNNTRNIANPTRQLKLAFVSSDFCAHAIRFFIQPLLTGLNKDEFHLTGYSDAKKVDHVTGTIRQLFDVWRDSSQVSDTQLAQQVNADKIDILVDLNGHTSGNRLGVFAKHVAPIQMSWLGYPSTTGLKSIGYRITDRIADPSELHDQFFSEKLLRLPNGFLCYRPLENAPDINPSGDRSRIRFGSFSNLAKISSLTLDCWSAALLAVPKSTLYIKRQQLTNKNASDFFIQQLADRGISEDRIIINRSMTKVEQHLDEYNNIDIALDTSPYNGATTTLDALWMGVPVISLKGQTHASRVTASILYRLNLSGLATNTVFEFAERAKELSELQETLQELRFSLRKRMTESALMNDRQFGREFGNTLRSQWRDWCHERDLNPALKKSLEQTIQAPHSSRVSSDEVNK